jgi:hypothetical protein
MTESNNSYKKVVEILRKSRPYLPFPENLEDKVINKIKGRNISTGGVINIIRSLFGWIYIGWLRRSLSVVAVIMVVLFVYQQVFILKQVNSIREQMIYMGDNGIATTEQEITKKLTLYKISNSLPGERESRVTEKQLDQLLKSYNEL